MPALTAILIAYNEEIDLPRALTSLAGVADEIILVDSGSTDRTCDIARAAGAHAGAQRLHEHLPHLRFLHARLPDLIEKVQIAANDGRIVHIGDAVPAVRL